MSKATFFSNTLIYVDIIEDELIESLANTRLSPTRVFSVPEHNVGTNNLWIFVDGEKKILDKHYEDINSFQIRFFNDISINQDFQALLRKNSGDGTGSTIIDLELKANEF